MVPETGRHANADPGKTTGLTIRVPEPGLLIAAFMDAITEQKTEDMLSAIVITGSISFQCVKSTTTRITKTASQSSQEATLPKPTGARPVVINN